MMAGKLVSKEAPIKFMGSSAHLCVLCGLRFLPTLNRSLPNRGRSRILAILSSALLILIMSAPVRAANAPDDVLLRALKEEMERSKAKLKMDNVAPPYYIEYRVTEVDAFDASATFGALRSQQRGSARFLRVVVRIGDYKQDSYYGAGQGAVDIIPLDDDMYAIRHRVWLGTDRAYKAAGGG